MPYKLRKAPKKNLYWVVNSETGKKHSKDPIPLEKAKAQMRLLYGIESGSIKTGKGMCCGTKFGERECEECGSEEEGDGMPYGNKRAGYVGLLLAKHHLKRKVKDYNPPNRDSDLAVATLKEARDVPMGKRFNIRMVSNPSEYIKKAYSRKGERANWSPEKLARVREQERIRKQRQMARQRGGGLVDINALRNASRPITFDKKMRGLLKGGADEEVVTMPMSSEPFAESVQDAVPYISPEEADRVRQELDLVDQGNPLGEQETEGSGLVSGLFRPFIATMQEATDYLRSGKLKKMQEAVKEKDKEIKGKGRFDGLPRVPCGPVLMTRQPTGSFPPQALGIAVRRAGEEAMQYEKNRRKMGLSSDGRDSLL